jgi:hypothetical protein
MKVTLIADLSKVEYAVMRVPFSVLAGWLTAATILNASIWLDCGFIRGMDAPNEQSLWSCIMIYISWFVYMGITIDQ